MAQFFPITAVADATGVATAALPSLPAGQRWKIAFIGIQSNSTQSSQAKVLLNNQFIIGSTNGNFDSASGEPSISITWKDLFQVQWSNCSVGAQCQATIWYETVDAYGNPPQSQPQGSGNAVR